MLLGFVILVRGADTELLQRLAMDLHLTVTPDSCAASGLAGQYGKVSVQAPGWAQRQGTVFMTSPANPSLIHRPHAEAHRQSNNSLPGSAIAPVTQQLELTEHLEAPGLLQLPVTATEPILGLQTSVP